MVDSIVKPYGEMIVIEGLMHNCSTTRSPPVNTVNKGYTIQPANKSLTIQRIVQSECHMDAAAISWML